MANMYNITGLNYYPSTNREWFSKSIFGGDLVERGKILPLENVKESTDLNLFDLVGKILQKDERDCSWTPEEIIKLSNKRLQVTTYKINLEQCIDVLETKNTVWLLTAGAKNDSLPTDLEGLTMERISQETSVEIETMIFGGDSSTNPDEFDGVTKTLSASADSIKVKGVTLTTNNIQDEIKKLYLSIPMAVRKSGKKEKTLCIYLSYEAHELMELTLGGTDNGNVKIAPNFSIDGDIIKYMNVELVPALGLNDSEMVASKWTNLILGTDLVSDYASAELKQFPFPHDNKVGIKGRMRLGFAIPFENEAVIYSPDVEDTPKPKNITFASDNLGEVGCDGISTVIDGIDQTPVYKLPKVGDLIEQINASEYVEDIQSILEIEAHTLRDSDNVKNAGEARITELKGGE